MKVTEADARQLWCPLARIRSYEAADMRAAYAPCIGARCMAWRWMDPPMKTETIVPANESPTGEPMTREFPNDARRGVCGLANLD